MLNIAKPNPNSIAVEAEMDRDIFSSLRYGLPQ
jgi:hypothetical protein